MGASINQINTNAMGLSNNIYGQDASGTNRAFSQGFFLSNGVASSLGAFSAITNGISTPYSDASSPSGSPYLAYGTLNGVSYGSHLGLDAFSDASPSTGILYTQILSMAFYVRLFFTCIVYAFFFFKAVSYLQTSILDAFGQRQIEGQKQEVLGVSADLPTSWAYAAIVVAVIATLLSFLINQGFISAMYSGSFTQLHASLNALSTGGAYAGHEALTYSSQAWNFCTMFFPVSAIIVAYLNYQALRYFYGFPLVIFTRGIIMFLTS
jgi:hypothetical protein